MTAASAFSAGDLARIPAESFIRHVEFHRELHSTNDAALHLAGERRGPVPLLVLAESQTAGRGRGANRWWAGPGALTFSLVLETPSPGRAMSPGPRVSLAAGLAVCEAFAGLLPHADIGLKWPNDVYLAGRKVSGSLVEVPSQASERLVVGVGINVNNSFQAAPVELQEIATSLCDVLNEPFSLINVLIAVLNELERRLQQVSDEQPGLAEVWRTRCLLSGRRVELTSGTRVATGTCLGIADDGALLLQTQAGLDRLYSGVVTKIDPAWSPNTKNSL